MKYKFISDLPEKFYSSISSPVKTMESLKKGTKIGTSIIYSMETIFLRLLTIGQSRQLQLAPVFEYELCAVPSSIIDEYGHLRKGTKSTLVQKLGTTQKETKAAEILIVDAQQLLHHVVWPVGGNISVLASSVRKRLDTSQYRQAQKVLVFDKYLELSPKDHERIRRAGAGSMDYNLTLQTELPCREAIMKSKNNKQKLSALLSTFDYGPNTTIDSKSDGNYCHDEADITIISYVLQAAVDGHKVIRVLTNDTDIFVLLVYWTFKAKIKAEVQMENWEGKVLSINTTCKELGQKSLELLGMHYLTGSDTTSYFYGKGKVSALKTLKEGNFSGLHTVLGETNASETDLMKVGEAFISAWYGQKPGTSMAEARYLLYTRKRGKPLKLMSLPPTAPNLLLHILRAHHAVMLGKAANQHSPPILDFTKFGWDINDGIPIPATANQPAGPPELLQVIACNCTAAGKACSTQSCSCNREGISCTVYCKCESGVSCFHPRKHEQEHEIEEEDENCDT